MAAQIERSLQTSYRPERRGPKDLIRPKPDHVSSEIRQTAIFVF